MVTSGGVKTALDAKLNTNGTNATQAALHGLFAKMQEETAIPVDADYYVAQHASGGAANKTPVKRPLSSLWKWIKGHCDTTYEKKDKVQLITNWEDFADGTEGVETDWVGQGTYTELNSSSTSAYRSMRYIFKVTYYPDRDRYGVVSTFKLYADKNNQNVTGYLGVSSDIISAENASKIPVAFLGYRVK